jgi:hypothetical protein
LQKGHTRADFVAVVEACRDAGLSLSPTFIPFTPWTTRASYTGMLRSLVELGLADRVSPVQLGLRLLITAGSGLLELPEIRDVIGEFDEAALLYPWRHRDPEVDELAAAVLDLIAREQKRGVARADIFTGVWRLASSAPLPDNFDLMPRATIPYLNEPWYC